MFVRFLILNLILCVTYSYANDYQLKDLRVLHSEKNYREYMQHALDLNPSKRDNSWREMTGEMGLGLLNELISFKEITAKDFELVKTISHWPLFKKNEFFIKKRDEVFIKQIAYCPQTKQEPASCKKIYAALYNDFSHSPIFPFTFLKAIGSQFFNREELWHFSKDFVKQDISEFYCHKTPLNKIIILQLQYEFQTYQKLKSQIHDDCLKSLRPTLEKILLTNESDNEDFAYYILDRQKLLSPEYTAFHMVIEFISNDYIKSDKLDAILKKLKYLSKNYKLRESVLKLYLQMDPFPDDIFKAQKKTDISRVTLLKRYFPELIDKYAHTCLAYLQGTREFKKGNPTPACHTLFDFAKKSGIIPESLIKQYDKATYFIQKKGLNK